MGRKLLGRAGGKNTRLPGPPAAIPRRARRATRSHERPMRRVLQAKGTVAHRSDNLRIFDLEAARFVGQASAV